MKKISCLGCLALLAACGPSDNEPGPGGVSVGEARALDEAAEMIEAKRLPQESDSNPSSPANKRMVKRLPTIKVRTESAAI